MGGVRYFVTFIDDKTRYVEVIMLKKRSDKEEKEELERGIT